jgi:hypothetical protein
LHPTACPICHEHERQRIQEHLDYFDCDICKGVYIDSRLVRAPTQLDNYDELLGAVREMRDKYGWDPTIRFDGTVVCPNANSEMETSPEFPKSVAQRAAKLLAALVRRTTHFGEKVTLTNSDYGLGYATSPQEMRAFVDQLEKQAHVTCVGKTMHDITVTVSADILDGTANQASPSAVRQMRILFLAANPTTTDWLDLEEELRSLESELRAVRHRDKITFVARHAVRPDDLLRYVRDDQPNVIHFTGHGNPDGIVLRDEMGGDLQISGSTLERFLKGRGVDLVVLNSCFSKDQADAIKGVVKAVVGTTDEVLDDAANRFTAGFYRGLGNGLSVKEAFRDGSDAVHLHGLTDVFHSDGDLELTLVS